MFLLASCKTKQATTAQASSMEQIICTYKVSAPTKRFIAELNQELESSKVAIINFEPSDKLKHQYQLKQYQGQYYIHGFMKTDPTFDPKKLEEQGIVIAAGKGVHKTVQVPMRALNFFLSQPQITYFEIGTTTGVKK